MKGIKQAFQSIASKVTNQPKGCVQCNDDDCAKCKGNQNSYDYVFGEKNSEPQPPQKLCFHYALINDSGCTGFAQQSCEWEINDGVHGAWQYSFDWSQYMINNYTGGGGGQYSSASCFGLPSTYVLRIINGSMISPISTIDIVDSNCIIGRTSFNTICDLRCFEVTFGYNPNICTNINLDIFEFGTIALFGDPVIDPVGFNGILTNNLQQIFGTGASSLTTYDSVSGLNTIQIFGIYTQFTPSMNYICGSPVSIPFNEITCP